MESNEFYESLLTELSERLSVGQSSITNASDQFAETARVLSNSLQVSLQCEADVMQNLVEVAASALNASTKSISYSAAELAHTLMDNISETVFACTDVTVPLQDATNILHDVQPILPKEATVVIEEKIEAEKRPHNKIPWRTIMEIITFIICVLGFMKECLPNEHEQMEETAYSAIVEKQNQENQLLEDIYDRIEELANDVVKLDDTCQKALDSGDLPNDVPDSEALDKADDGQT